MSLPVISCIWKSTIKHPIGHNLNDFHLVDQKLKRKHGSTSQIVRRKVLFLMSQVEDTPITLAYAYEFMIVWYASGK